MARTMFKARCLILQSHKNVCEFDYQEMNMFEFVRCSKKDVLVSSISNLVNLLKALLGSMSDVRLFEAKNRVFEFDYK